MTPKATSEIDAATTPSPLPVIARLETDRFCDGCGYNLYTQAVHRDPRTQLLLCRCPECGRVHSVRDHATIGRVWLHRLGTLGLFAWILALLAVEFGLAMAQLGVTVGTLEELTTFGQTGVRIITSTQPGVVTIVGPSSNTVWRREAREEVDYYAPFLALMSGLAFTIGFLSATLLVVAAHHWRRWIYLLPVLLMPLAVGLLVWYLWGTDHPHLRAWSSRYVVWNGVANILGGVVGVYFGRPLARLLVTVLLPPRPRQVLAFLWRADGKSPPSPVRGV